MAYCGLVVDKMSGDVELLVVKRRGSVAAPLGLGHSQLMPLPSSHPACAHVYLIRNDQSRHYNNHRHSVGGGRSPRLERLLVIQLAVKLVVWNLV